MLGWLINRRTEKFDMGTGPRVPFPPRKKYAGRKDPV